MRKRLGLLTVLLTIPFISGCSFLSNSKPSDNPGGDVTDDTVDVENISLSLTSLTLDVNETSTIIATISPENATNKTITWTSNNLSVATVNNGVVTALSSGDAVITAKTSNDKTATCSVHVNEINVNVLSISLDQTELTLNVGDEATILATINPDDASNKTLTWTSNNSSVATVNNGVVTALSPGDAVITAKSSNDKTATCSVHVNEIIQPDWSETEKAIFNSHLYEFKLPFVDGLTATYDNKQDCVVVTKESMTQTDFDAYVASIVALGFTKENGPDQNTYTLLKEFTYGGKLRTIEIDIFLQEGALGAVCYDPYQYEFIEGFIPYVFQTFYFKAPKAQVPDVPGDRYIYDTNKLEYQSLLIIYAENQTNCEASYAEALTTNGFTISAQKNEYDYFVAVDPEKIVEIDFAYDATSKVFTFIMQPYASGWPSGAINYYLSQILPKGSSTILPELAGADFYEFIDSSWDRYGYFFILCETNNNLESAYKEALNGAGYTVFDDSVNAAGNYFAISRDEDLLVQYEYIVVESISGGNPYKHIDVLFEPYYPHDGAYIAEKLQLVVPGTETVIPEYPGYGEEVSLSDTNKHLNIVIQSCTRASLQTYLNTLDQTDWNVKTISETLCSYEAVSPNRDVILETSLADGRIQLSFSKYEDKYSSWPVDGIAEILEALDLTGTVPEFEGAYGFDYELNIRGYYDVVCFVKTNKEEELISQYINKLTNNGWVAVQDGEATVYVHPGYTIALYPYTEYIGEGKIFIDISFGDIVVYNIDARDAFNKWKFDNEIESNIILPGINITADIVDYSLYGDEGETYSGYELFELLVDLGDANINDAAVEVINQFVADGWVYSIEDEFYHKDTLFMTAYEFNGYLAIDVCAPIPKRDLLTVMNTFINDLEPEETIILPESLNIADEYYLEIDSYYIGYSIDLTTYLTFSTSTQASNAYTAIINAFKAKGWTQTDSKSKSITLKDSSNSLELYVQKINESLLVQFSEPSYW
ncbi:MAG: Ig domain-containing protein [Bacilli bacterium]|nr:Ig domain-containing protein [Bacilli bacterium]